MNREIPRKQVLGQLFSMLSSEGRLSALELFAQGMALGQIAARAGMSRSGFQKVVEAFRQLGIIERAGHRSSYRLSAKGQKILELVREFAKQLEPIEKEVAKEKIRMATYGSGLTREEIASLLQELEKKSRTRLKNEET